MNEGDEYPAIYDKAKRLFANRLKDNLNSAKRLYTYSKNYKEIMKSKVPPYDPTKFPNKWWKMESCKPSRTLTAHLGKDSYSHIHYDRYQARTISVREAARLQSFPDGFVFAGGMNDAFKQIGNAVPPLLAYRIATSIAGSVKFSAREIC